MLKDYNEKQFANFLLEYLQPSFQNSNFCYQEWYDFEDEFPNIDFQKLQEECKKLGFFMEKASAFADKNMQLKNSWEQHKTVIFFLKYENLT